MSESVVNVWDFFKKVNVIQKLAICMFCNKMYSYKTTIANLRHHLNSIHFESVNLKKASDLEADNVLWDYYDKAGDDDDIVVCKLCDKQITFRIKSTTNNLRSHLKWIHSDVFETLQTKRKTFDSYSDLNNSDGEKDVKGDDQVHELESSDDDNDVYFQLAKSQEQDEVTSTRRKRSLIWTYFIEIDERQAQCRLCLRNLSYRSTTFNLKIHLQRKHPDAFDRFSRSLALDTDEDMEGDASAVEYEVYEEQSNTKPNIEAMSIWSYFKKGTDGRAECELCHATVPHSHTDVTSHIRRSHPGLLETTDTGEDSQPNIDENNDDKDNIFTEILYLEEDSATPIKRSKRKANVFALTDGKNRFKTSPKEHTPKTETCSEDEEVENFGKYITTLLKSLPKDLCTKVQLEIVSMILKLKIDTKSPSKETDEGSKLYLRKDNIVVSASNDGTNVGNEIATLDNDNAAGPSGEKEFESVVSEIRESGSGSHDGND